MADPRPVVVVGAGPAGLAVAACLRRVGAPVVVLERGEVGAAWLGRYDRLALHTARRLSSLPGYPIPRAFGRWPSRDGVVEYLRRYAQRNRLDVRTRTEVTAIEPSADGWLVRAGGDELRADRVVVATGYSNVPFVPDWPGAFDGRLVHSSAYRNPDGYRGRRALVVGAGNSAAEIAVDLAGGGAAAVSLAVRTPPSIVRRDVLGVPSQLLGIASMRLPAPVVDRTAAALRRVSIPDLAPYGLPAPARPYSEFVRRRVIPILDVGIVDAVRSGRVRVVPAVERLDGDAVVLAGGARLEVDDVVAATGFRPGLEPLVGSLGMLDERGEPLVHGAEEHPRAPRLHFVGYRVTLGGALRLAGIEARALARSVAVDRRGPNR